MACPNSCRILQTFSLPVILFMPRPIASCFAGFTWLFVTLKSRSGPRENASLCSSSVGSGGLTQRSPMQNFVHLSGMGSWPFWKCWDLKTFGSGSRVIFTVSNNCRGDLAAFNNMVLSSSAVSRLPQGRDGTISLSRLASNITVHIFCYYRAFLLITKVFLYFGKNSLLSKNVNIRYISLCRSSETTHEGKYWILAGIYQWHVFKCKKMCWCRHHQEWQYPGVLTMRLDM